MIHLFEHSFYAGYFLHIPENIMCSALEQVYRDMKKSRVMCPALFEEMFELEAALFLRKFFGSSDLSYTDNEGNVIPVASLSTSGAKSTVKRDSIDSSVSREYFKPEFIAGEEATDFPLGHIKERLAELKHDCELANSVTIGVGADFPCGWDHCKTLEAYNYGYKSNCKSCR